MKICTHQLIALVLTGASLFQGTFARRLGEEDSLNDEMKQPFLEPLYLDDGLRHLQSCSVTNYPDDPLGSLDQSNIEQTSSSGTADGYFGQSFKSGLTGLLAEIDVFIWCSYGGFKANLNIYPGALEPFSGTLPTPLLSQEVQLSPCSCWSQASDFTRFILETQVPVVAGESYTFLITGAGQINAPINKEKYLDGLAYSGAHVPADTDLLFKTFVLVDATTVAPTTTTTTTTVGGEDESCGCGESLEDINELLVDIHNDIQTNINKLDDATDDLSAVNTNIQTNTNKLDGAIDSLSAINANVQTNTNKLDDATNGLSTILSSAQTNTNMLNDATNGLSVINANVQTNTNKLDDADIGLEAINNKLADINAKLDSLFEYLNMGGD